MTTLEDRLRDLGRALPTTPVPDHLVDDVLARVAHEPVPVPSRWRRRLVGLVAGFVGAGVVLSPVGAQVVEWLQVGAVDVRVSPGAPSGDAEVPEAGGRLTLTEAAERAGFDPGVPASLGEPEGVEVSDGFVGMTWGAGATTMRLDQVDAPLAPYFWKSAGAVTATRVGGAEALWFDEAHELVVLGHDGAEATAPPRLAARTLVWAVGDRTYRLEGDLTRAKAVAIAESVR